MPGSINLSLLYAGHTNDLHINTACGPPRNFRHASTCPRIDRPASGLILLTPRTFNTSSQALLLRTCWFPYGFPLRLTFANRINSLARSSKRTVRHRQPCSYIPPHSGFLHKEDPFMPHPAITCQFQALLTTFPGLLFSFRSRYYFAIGFKVYLALEVDDPRLPARIPTRGTQDSTRPCLLMRTGLSPSIVCHSRQLPLHIQVSNGGLTTPHLPLPGFGLNCVVFVRHY